jgi:Asparagine synthase
VYFTLAISAATPEACAALVSAATGTDPRVLPIPGPPSVTWRAADERAALVCWGLPPDGDQVTASHAGTIWADRGTLHARTGVARVDPVYLAEVRGAAVVSDRACWAAAVTGRLDTHDPVMAGAFLAVGYPVGAVTPFRGVRALGCDQRLTVTAARLTVTAARLTVTSADGGDGDGGTVAGRAGGGRYGGGRYGAVAGALVDAVRPAGESGVQVELSLTGGKDSRLIAAALTAAKVPFRARTHGFASHPDVVVAAMIASRLGVEHVVTEPRPADAGQPPDEADLLARLRSAVLMSDGMLSAFENIGRPDPRYAAEPVQAGGHGGELLRGGYAPPAWTDRRPARAWSDARGVELFRRLTTRRAGLLRPRPAAAYLASLAPYAAALRRGSLRTLDDFYLANRAGRWSAAARQAYLMRSPLLQPFFDDRVVRAARGVPLPDRITDRLHRGVLAELCPHLLNLPLAGSGWKSGPRVPGVPAARAASGPGSAGPGSPGPGTPGPAGTEPGGGADWRRAYGEQMARLLREYTLDLGAAGGLFDLVRRPAAERVLRPPHADPAAAWALATMAALLSGDWLNAREVSRGRTSSPPARRTARLPQA